MFKFKKEKEGFKKNKNLVVFDFDGVLADSRDLAIEVYKEHGPRYNLTKIETKEEMAKILHGNIPEAMKSIGLKKRHIPFIIADALFKSGKYLTKMFLFPSIEDALKDLGNRKDLEIYILTSSFGFNVKKMLKRYEISNGKNNSQINKIIGFENERSKYKSLKKILETKRLQPNEVLFITDTVGDTKDAQKLNIPVGCTTYGYDNKENLKQYNPIIWIESPNELKSKVLKYFSLDKN